MNRDLPLRAIPFIVTFIANNPAVTTGKASTTYIHLSSVIGCRVSRKHPSQFRLVVYKVRESKRYDFQTQSPEAAAEIVREINKAAEPFQGLAGGGGGAS